MTYQAFIRTPKPGERHLAGRALGDAEAHDCPLRAQLARLSRRLYLPHPWPATSPSGHEPWENPSIPSGYTYLSQFVAHDTVLSTVPTACQRAGRSPPRNARAMPLELQTLYGAGFDGCLTAMSDADRDDLRPAKLPVGRIRLASDATAATCPFRDLPRSHAQQATPARKGLTVVAIPDDRNDNNVFVSQTTLLFTQFHNCIVDLLHRSRASATVRSQAYFATLHEDAKHACTQAYRRIVRNDLLRRLLHPRVYALYASTTPFYFDDREDALLTYEYAQALRFGHAMVRPHYRVNDVVRRREELIDALLTTSRGRPWRLPLDESWPVQWSKFYTVAGSTPNLSRRLAPSFSIDLVSGLVFERIDGTETPGLAYRDLVNSAGMPTWSVEALIAELKALAPSFFTESRLLSDAEHRRRVLVEWLSHRREASGMTDADIDEIGRDPPLFLFILLEAAHESGGRHLGHLGSIIVGEPLFKILDRTHEDAIAHARPRATAGALQELSRIADMPALIGFMRAYAGIEEELVPFV